MNWFYGRKSLNVILSSCFAKCVASLLGQFVWKVKTNFSVSNTAGQSND